MFKQVQMLLFQIPKDMINGGDEFWPRAEENLLKAFDKFTQIENSLSRKVGGTGLGLPIAKQLIKAHKGTIWCDSEEEKGSSFHFALPVMTEKLEEQEIHRKIL